MNDQVAVVIVAAGSSTRMGGRIKKEYLPLNKGTVLSTVARTFLNTGLVSSLVIVHPAGDVDSCKEALNSDKDFFKDFAHIPVYFAAGGNSRQESVFNALTFLEKNAKPDYVLIHDGARPFLSEELVRLSIRHTIEHKASVPYLEPSETQKEINGNKIIVRHLERRTLASVQTPQGFDFNAILSAHKTAHTDGKTYTDDTEINDTYNEFKTFAFTGESQNIKITYPQDIKQNSSMETKMIRTGLGYDLHKLVEGRKLIVGGIEIPFEKGELGHSDGDALLHAITDSLLGASGLGDIGSFFPDTDPQFKDADSAMLLQKAWKCVQDKGWKLENLDCVVLLEKPKFLPYRTQVQENIAKILNVNPDQIFVKAKTGEKLGDVGSSNAIEVFATCLLRK